MSFLSYQRNFSSQSNFRRNWRQVTDDDISLLAIMGVKIPLLGKPPVRRASKAEVDERRMDPVIDEAVKVVSTQAVLVSLINSLQELSKLKAVQEMQEEDEVFLSRVFTVPKTERGKGVWQTFHLKTKSESSPYFLGIRAR